MSRPCQVCGGERGLTMVCTRCDRSKTFTNGERSAAEPRLTEAEARAILRAADVCKDEGIGPASGTSEGDAWDALIVEAKARLGR